MKKLVLLASIILIISQTILAEENKMDIRTGFIFSIENILLDLESYQGGIGFKVGKDQFFGRAMIDFYYTNHESTLQFDALGAFEYHFNLNRISPYLGVFAGAGYGETLISEIDEQNWTKQVNVPISVGPFVGAEFYIFDFFSIFAEYAVTANFIMGNQTTAVGGTETTTEDEWTTVIDAGLGNGAKLGLIFYLD